MSKLLIAPMLSLIVACGPLSGRATRHDHEDKKGAAAVPGGDAVEVKSEVSLPQASKGSGQDDDGDMQSPAQTPSESPTQTPSQTPAETPALSIKDIRYRGNACPDASVAANISPDRRAFTLLFDSFAVEVPRDAKGQTKQGSCELEIDLDSKQGWQLTVLTVDERGYAALNDGDLATLTTTIGFAPKGQTAHFEATLRGAMDDNFQKRATARLLTAPWSGCEAVKTLRVTLAAAIKAATALPSYLAVDAVDGELHHEAGLRFRRCE